MTTMITIETAKRLKELGFPQNTVMCYCIEADLEWLSITADVPFNEYEQYACPTFEEIWYELWKNLIAYQCIEFENHGLYAIFGTAENPRKVMYEEYVKDNNYSEAAVKLWIQLKEKQLI